MSLSVKGKISSKLSVENGTSKAGKEWKKQSFLVDTGAQYNPEICFQLFGEDKITMLNITILATRWKYHSTYHQGSGMAGIFIM